MKTLLILGVCLFAGLANAQFDPNCYYPVIGVDIDTVYGSKNEQMLGDNIVNLGQRNGDNYGTIGVYGLPGHLGKFSTFSSGPDFNIHQLKNVKEFPLELGGSKYYSHQFGHFRDREHIDLFTFNGVGRIFWSDEEGNFDTSRYTVLRSDLPQPPQSLLTFDQLSPYITNLTSDTVEDILLMGYQVTIDHQDSMYLFLFNGGNSLYNKGQIAYQDSILNLGYISSLVKYTRRGFYAQFLGSTRKDGLFYNDSLDFFLYQNTPPFSMKKFANAIQYDTLLSKYENPTLYNFNEAPFSPDNSLAMQAFRRHDTSDHSVDLLMSFVTKSDSSRSLWIFKGGPEFGSKRLYMDKPDAFLWHPKHYDSGWKGTFFFDILRDCGDMTGTGNRVLSAYGAPFAGGTGFSQFYVLGDALDDKVDMFYTSENFVGIPDTITADGDNLQDIILGDAIALSDKDDANGWNNVGAIGLLKGTKKIPVKLNTVRKNIVVEERVVNIYPNPVRAVADLSFTWGRTEEVHLTVRDILGQSLLERTIRVETGKQTWQMNFSELPSGAYIITLQGLNDRSIGRMTLIK